MLSEILKYEDLKLYYISATSLLAFILLRKIIQGRKYDKDTRIDGKVVVITGGNCGIGKETAIELASRGANVYLACRSLLRGEQACQEIIKKSGNSEVSVRLLNLSSFQSIREFATKFTDEVGTLHVLINNAGIMAPCRSLTVDGHELQFGVNHLGHFLLTNLLLDVMKKSAPSRIVTVSSMVHKFGTIKKDDLNSEKSYSEFLSYCQSKLANILFTRELSRKLEGTGVTANALHPGAINTELSRNIGNISIIFNKIFVKPFLFLFFKTANAGAQTTLYASLDPELKHVTGKYFSECKEANISKGGMDQDMAAWLWSTSEKLTKLDTKTN